MGQINQTEREYTHIVMEGTPYEVGRQQAEAVSGIPGLVNFYTKPLESFGTLTPAQLEEVILFNDQYCPGLNEEIRGFADGLKVPAERILYYSASYPRGGACGQMAVLPEITADGHLYVGRSYEWSMDDEMRLCTTRVKGKAAHIGFSIFLFGRFDGMNEHGLVVTMSAGCPGMPPKDKGVRFWVAIRAVLDQCRTVDEAEKLLKEIPISFNVNIIVADRSGEAALFEIAGPKVCVKRIGKGSQDQYVYATNQFTLPEMIDCDNNRMWQSLARLKAIERTLEATKPRIGKEDIRSILSSHVPDGLACHYYEDGLGTLWSELFDVTAGSLELCFGSPLLNGWHTFGLKDPVGVTAYTAKFINDAPKDPDSFWKRLLPGSTEL